MPELMDSFDTLFADYKAKLPHACYSALSRKELYRQMPDAPGVYIVFREGQEKPVYIGCAGEIARGARLTDQTLLARIRSGHLPRGFDDCGFQYDAHGNKGKRSTTQYHHSIPLAEIKVCTLETPGLLAPAALEHLLIQGVINQYGDLPEANQKI
jgi:hypothetical protein